MPVEGRDLSSRQTQYVVKDLGDWATYKLRQGFRNCRWRCTRSKRVKSCPRAGCGKSARPVRGAGCGNGVTVEPLRHRQTKGAATDMFGLQQPRHISTLPWSCENSLAEAYTRRDLGEAAMRGHFSGFGGSFGREVLLKRIPGVLSGSATADGRVSATTMPSSLP